ncbi:hypothetical protein niasHS_010776 [Heterodera schachtii]|uniref:Transmembrane protein n=1 Tax=Heterodera schachtii TaxID=97005 RepID=A0ABD2ISK1_HETSC
MNPRVSAGRSKSAAVATPCPSAGLTMLLPSPFRHSSADPSPPSHQMLSPLCFIHLFVSLFTLPCFSSLFRFCLILSALPLASLGQLTAEPAVRVVRFHVSYPDAELESVRKLTNWNIVMRKSVLASLRFVNKHWLICGEVRETTGEKSNSGADCGKLQVTGEETGERSYRINATFITNRDPVRNAKVDANSSVLSVLQIGLKGGIFQYTNAMKVLGKPETEMAFEEAFFCYPGQKLEETDKCRANEEKREGKTRQRREMGREANK